MDGADGATGPAGMNGQDGNANVFSSDWIEPVISDYSVNNSTNKALPLSIPNYDENKDVLLIYYYDQFENNVSYSYVYQLPYYGYDAFGEDLTKSVTINIRPASSTAYVNIRSYNRNLLAREYLWEPDAGNLDNKGVRFRYMIIEGNSTTKTHNSSLDKSNVKPFDRVKHELSTVEIDINDYHAVCDYYGIAY